MVCIYKLYELIKQDVLEITEEHFDVEDELSSPSRSQSPQLKTGSKYQHKRQVPERTFFSRTDLSCK